MTNPLRLKPEETDEEPPASACPSCGAPLEADAVICVQCGYDIRAKRRVTPGQPARANPLLIGALLLVIVGALAVVFLRAGSGDSAPALVVQQAAPAPQTALPAATEPEPAPPAPTPSDVVPIPAPAPQLESPPAATEPEPVEAAAEPDTPQEPEVDWAAMQTELRARAESDLDRRAPLFATGELIELRTTNGIIQRGVFRAMAEGQLTIAVTTNDTRHVPLVALDRNTRIRLDADYRSRYLDYVVNQRIAEMKKTEATGP